MFLSSVRLDQGLAELRVTNKAEGRKKERKKERKGRSQREHASDLSLHLRLKLAS